MNKFYGVGYLVADLETREVGDKMVANGAIAISRKYAADKTDFINISIWGKGAEYLVKYAKKGTMLAIAGELQIEKKNDKFYTRINVDDFKFWNNKQTTEPQEGDQVTEAKSEWELPDSFFDNTDNLPF